MSIKIASRKSPPPPPIAERLAVSKKEAAAMLGVSERSLDNWAKQGKIVVRRAGTRVLFPVKALQDFINGIDSANDTEQPPRKNITQ